MLNRQSIKSQSEKDKLGQKIYEISQDIKLTDQKTYCFSNFEKNQRKIKIDKLFKKQLKI